MSASSSWAGRTAIVTGANSGIGLETARALAKGGARVILACRSLERGAAAATEIAAEVGSADAVVVRRLDLADFASIRAFAEGVDDGLDALVANAAVMACPLAFTTNGLELQMGTNHFGHALLTSLLVARLAQGGRIVVVASIAARRGRLTEDMTLEDLTAPVPYRSQQVYANSKQANLLFAYELARRLAAGGSSAVAVAAHPGVAPTELFARQLRDNGRGFLVPLVRPAMRIVLQSPTAGAAAVVRAATDPALTGGELIGPRRLAQTRGRPELLAPYRSVRDPRTASRLWKLTEQVLEGPLLP